LEWLQLLNSDLLQVETLLEDSVQCLVLLKICLQVAQVAQVE
jgi:hypothetical protein